jgi:hypothetical protein
MKIAKLLSLAVTLGIAGVASAEGPLNYPEDVSFTAAVSAADVDAGIDAARRAGLLCAGEVDVSGGFADAGAKSRAEVRAELRAARRLGLLMAAGEAEVAAATPEQERLIAEAGRNAGEHASH